MPVLNIKKYTGPVALVPTCMYAPFYAKFIVAKQRPPSSKHTRRMDLYDNKPQVHTPTLLLLPPCRLAAIVKRLRSTELPRLPPHLLLESVKTLLAPLARDERLHKSFGHGHWIRLSFLSRCHLDVAWISAQLHVIATAIRAIATPSATTRSQEPSKVPVVTIDESQLRRLLPRPTEGTLVNVEHHGLALTQDLSQPAVVPHIRVAWLLQNSRGVGGNTVLHEEARGVQRRIPRAKSTSINFPKRLAPGVVREPTRPLLRPNGPTRPVPRRGERRAR